MPCQRYAQQRVYARAARHALRATLRDARRARTVTRDGFAAHAIVQNTCGAAAAVQERACRYDTRCNLRVLRLIAYCCLMLAAIRC